MTKEDLVLGKDLYAKITSLEKNIDNLQSCFRRISAMKQLNNDDQLWLLNIDDNFSFDVSINDFSKFILSQIEKMGNEIKKSRIEFEMI